MTESELVKIFLREGRAKAQAHEIIKAEQATDKGQVSYAPNAVDLEEYLTGDWEPPQPTIGAQRVDGLPLLYEGAFHAVVGPPGCGKSWLAAWEAAAVLASGRAVAYAHFEESRPTNTINRLRALGVPLDVIRERFYWVPTDRPLQVKATDSSIARCVGGAPMRRLLKLHNAGGNARDLEAKIDAAKEQGRDLVGLLILDGILAACGLHGWDPKVDDGAAAFFRTLVHPVTQHNIAVLALGHPVKDPTRASDRNPYGSVVWLGQTDGVMYRMRPGAQPIRRGTSGSASLHSVKDREGGVEERGVLDPKAGEGWTYMGQLVVDSTPLVLDEQAPMTIVRLTVPNQDGTAPDGIDQLADQIVEYLTGHGNEYPSKAELINGLRGAGGQFDDRNVGPAIDRLAERGRLVKFTMRGRHGGRLAEPDPDPATTSTAPDSTELESQ